MDTNYLKKFIRVKDGDIDAALNSMKKYYESLNRNRRAISGIKPLDYTNVYKSGAIVVLKRDFNGVRVIVQSWRYWKPKDYGFRSFINATGFLVENCLENPVTQKHGIAVVMDLEGFSLRHALSMNPREAFRGVETCLVKETI